MRIIIVLENKVNSVKKENLVPLIVLLLGLCFVGAVGHRIDSHETEQRHATAQLNAVTYGERIIFLEGMHL